MATYGTIPTSPTSPSSIPNNLNYITHATQTIKDGLGTRHPWNLMFNLHSFNVPSEIPSALSRIRYNVSFFCMNYAIVVLLTLFLSLLWRPISLIVFTLVMAAWLYLYFLRDQPLVLFGRIVDDHVVLVFMALVTVALLLLTHASVNILVGVSVGVVVMVVHATYRKVDDLYLDEEEGLVNTVVDAATS
ncbi:hypothetical protein TanjilG_18133 [Lupinus angustifolius]|uniref:PRA1 family protein n=1 Tax=Lupinus angustifolius TaxID=3871 RepID=A0A1J7IS04_LUPAN|nr:PREDICTED: PRA1 family protein F3-like [Lupinus angustifolius]OIW17178.1 hypothetical protein TanjilG_18133 [Lupinus angustifolius]